MSALQSLEENLDDLLVKQVPPLPTGAKRFLVEYLPWINLVMGLLSLYAAYGLWVWAHTADNLTVTLDKLSAATGGPGIAPPGMSFEIWIGLLVLVVEGLLYLAAFPGTRDRKKSGWNLLFYAILINLAYGVLTLFTSYGGVGHFIWTVVVSAIGLYLLFQIRASYLKAPARARARKKA